MFSGHNFNKITLLNLLTSEKVPIKPLWSHLLCLFKIFMPLPLIRNVARGIIFLFCPYVHPCMYLKHCKHEILKKTYFNRTFEFWDGDERFRFGVKGSKFKVKVE